MGLGGKFTPKKSEIAERRKRALDMRIKGYSLQQIADELGVAIGTVHIDLNETFKDLHQKTIESGETLRELELQRLDMALHAIALQVASGDLGAIDRWIKLSERRAKLLGLDLQRTDITSGGEPLKAYIGISPDTWDE